MADSSCGEEEEYEYEEVEVEEEVEEEEEIEEIEEEEEEIEEEEEEEDEEIVEEEEKIPEVEEIPEEEEEEEYEEVEEEVEEEEEEEEEEYEEVEEEIEEEVEVSDDDEEMTAAAAADDTAEAIDVEMAMEAVAEAKAKAIEEEEEEEKTAVIDKETAMEAVAEAKAEKEEAIDESAVGLSDLRDPVADQSHCDVRLDEESKRNEVCSRSRLRDTVNSELVASLDDCQQNRKGKDVLSINDGSVNLPAKLNSVPNLRKLGDDTVESEQGPVEINPLGASVKNQQSHFIHVTPAVASGEHVSTPDSIHDKQYKIESNDINDKRGPVEIIPLAATEQSHDMHVTPAVTSMEHVSTPDGTHDKLCKSETTDIDEMRFPSQREDLHLPPSGSMDQKASRYYTPQSRLRSSSPGGETDISSKRPAMICEFFAKGWCIKGSSCRFLHKRDQVDHSRGQVEGNMLSTKVETCPSKDSGDASGASVSRAHNQPKYLRTDSDDLLPISTAGMSTEKDHREPVRDNNDFRLLERDGLYRRLSSTSQRSPSSKDGSKLASSRNEAVVDMLNGNRSYDDLDHRGSSVSFGRSALLDNAAPDHGSLQRGIAVYSDAQLNSLHPYAIVEESIALRRQYTLELHSSPIYEFSAGSSNSFRNSSLSDNSSLKDMLISYKKRRFTPYNWEPSVPFRPSSLINSLAASSSEVPYDPLRDSIEQPNIGHDLFRRSSYQHAENISRRNSLESPKRLHGDSNDKDCCSRDKDAHVVEAESAAISATNAVNNIMSDENNPVVAESVKDVLKSTKSISDGSSNKLTIGGPKQNGEIGRQTNNGLDEDKTRVIKIFRAALIEFVKELMKPVWHEGRLSKDVYKVIVQKAEDKILSTLPSNEVPNTPEAIKLYLSSSRPNILKLIQAYVDKYGKF